MKSVGRRIKEYLNCICQKKSKQKHSNVKFQITYTFIALIFGLFICPLNSKNFKVGKGIDIKRETITNSSAKSSVHIQTN